MLLQKIIYGRLMSLNIDIKIDQDLLTITSFGIDNDFEKSQEYALAILQVVYDTQCPQILCDEREVEYRLNENEAYELFDFIANNSPEIDKIAIVHKPQYQKFTTIWKTKINTQEYGHRLNFFIDIDQAKKWLEEK